MSTAEQAYDGREQAEYDAWVADGSDPSSRWNDGSNPLINRDLNDDPEPGGVAGFGTGAAADDGASAVPGGVEAFGIGAAPGANDGTIELGGGPPATDPLDDDTVAPGSGPASWPLEPDPLHDDTVDYGGGPPEPVPAAPEPDDTVDYGGGSAAGPSDDDLGVH